MLLKEFARSSAAAEDGWSDMYMHNVVSALCGLSCACTTCTVASYEFRLQRARTRAGIWLEEVAEINTVKNIEYKLAYMPLYF